MTLPQVALIATFAAFGFTGCGQPNRPSVLLITVDTLRGDRLGCAGYSNASTPNIDNLARQGLYFSHASSPVPITLPSHASIFTGLTPPLHGIRDNTPRALPIEAQTLAESLLNSDYHTAAFIGSQPLALGCGLEQGFGTYQFDSPPPSRGSLFLSERTADQVADAAIDWLNHVEKDGKPFFLWVHFFDPHAPYTPPPSVLSRVSGDAYDAEIAHVDEQIGRVLTTSRRSAADSGLLEVFTADHGESLGDHGETTHAYFAYESTLRVPLIFAGPGIQPSSTPDNRGARLIDIMPTILDLLDIECPKVQGVSLLKENPGPAYSESLYCNQHFGWAQITAVRIGNRKLIDAGRLFYFDLGADPKETQDLARGRAHRVPRDLIEALEEFRAMEHDAVLSPYVPSIPGYLTSPLQDAPRLLSPEENSRLLCPLDSSHLVSLFESAVQALSSSNPSGARAPLEKALSADPLNPTFLFWMGRVEWIQADRAQDPSNWREALRWFDKAIEVAPNFIDAHNLAIHCLANLGEFQEAKSRVERLESESLTDGWTYEVMGRLYLTTESGGIRNPFADPHVAVDYLEKAVDRLPSSIHALQLLISAYTQTDQNEKSARMHQRLTTLSGARAAQARRP